MIRFSHLAQRIVALAIALAATSALAAPVALVDDSKVPEAPGLRAEAAVSAPGMRAESVVTSAPPAAPAAATLRAGSFSTPLAATARNVAAHAQADSADPAELLAKQLRSEAELEATSPARAPKAVRSGEPGERTQTPAAAERDGLPSPVKESLKAARAWLQTIVPWVFGEPHEQDGATGALGRSAGLRDPYALEVNNSGTSTRRAAAHEPGARAEASIQPVAMDRAGHADLWDPVRIAVAWLKTFAAHPVTWLALFLAGLAAMSMRLMKRNAVHGLAKRPQAAIDIPVRHRPSRRSHRSSGSRR